MPISQAPSLKGYRILRAVGSGGMSTVYEAVDEKLKRRVALKVLHPHLLKESLALERFKREALSASKMDHPNIVRIYDYFFEPAYCCIAMEYVDGCDMDRVVKEKGALPEGLALDILHPVAVALKEAHEQGVMHRDIKPSNILLHKKNRVILSDFGLAFHFADTHLTADNLVAGTPQYMSPEQISGKPLSFGSDIYSWGVTLHFILTARLPYPSMDFYELVSAIRNGATEFDPAVRNRLPPKYFELLERCLWPDPASRFPSGTELASWIERNFELHPPDLSQILPSRAPDGAGAMGASALPSPAPDSRTQMLPRGKGRNVLVWTGLAAFLVFGIAYLFSRPVPEPPQGAGVASSPAPAPAAVALPVTPPAPKPEPSRPQKNKPPLPLPAAVDSGQFFAFSDPWSNIAIDGREYGKTPWETPVSLPVGAHTIKLYNDCCEPRMDTIEILPRRIIRRRYQLALKPQDTQ